MAGAEVFDVLQRKRKRKDCQNPSVTGTYIPQTPWLETASVKGDTKIQKMECH